MQKLENIISYYRDCYAFDLKSVNLFHFFNKDISNQYIFDSLDHLTGKFDNHPVESVWAKSVDEELAIHSKEKQLYTGSFFLKGKIKKIGKTVHVFSPLYLHETSIILENGVYYIYVDLANPIFNPAFIELLKNKIEINSELEREFINKLPTGKFDFEALINLKEIFESLFPQVDVSSLSNLIHKNSLSTELRKIAASKSDRYHLKLITGSALGLTKKSKGARGIIQELDLIKDRSLTSKLLNQTFGIGKSIPEKAIKSEIYTPSSLSQSQQDAIRSLQSNEITLVIGPPGTGKTYTIANLAAHLIGEGKSALIVCKTIQATKVIMSKIQNDLGIKGKVINATSQRYKRSLKSKLNSILYGIKRNKPTSFNSDATKKELKAISNSIDILINEMIKSENDEIKWGKLYFSNKNKFLNLFKSKWIEYKKNRKDTINKQATIWKRKEIDKRKKSKKFILSSYDEFLSNSLNKYRKEFIALTEALDQKIGNLIHDKFEEINFKLILDALPIWICTTDNLHNTLPLKANLFDVVIIDEATQCDIPSAIPLLYRAKKAIIVGDPKQLRHISFLSKAQESALKIKNNLNQSLPDYRTNSILDLINYNIEIQNQVVFLNEHYRSVPSIIDFSNKNFYDHSLHVMTDKPSIQNKDNGISIIKTDGHRNQKGINEIEANLILKKISNIVEVETELENKFKSTIGILSPFRDQVNYIKKELRKNLSLNEIKKHSILVGTPHHFQGEERDIMCLSFALDNNAHHSSFQYLNKEDVFNVSITRARKKQIIFTSLNFEKLPSKYLLGRYLNSIPSYSNQNNKPLTSDDNFSFEVTKAIVKNVDGARVIANFLLGGLEIDLVVVYNNKTYCIDLIGYPGDFAPMFSFDKIRMLDRMEIDIFFLTYSDWNLDKEKCIKNMNLFFNK